MTAVHAAPTGGPTVPSSILAGASSSANEAIIARTPQTARLVTTDIQMSPYMYWTLLFLSDTEAWADMFTSAGFSIRDGVFLA